MLVRRFILPNAANLFTLVARS